MPIFTSLTAAMSYLSYQLALPTDPLRGYACSVASTISPSQLLSSKLYLRLCLASVCRCLVSMVSLNHLKPLFPITVVLKG